MSKAVAVAATCVAIPIEEVFKAVLLRGPPGSGKSDLALRLIDSGARLVADDQVMIAEEDGNLIARPPQIIRGRMEVRGLGIVAIAALDAAPLVLIIDLVSLKEVPRMPEPAFELLAGVKVPRVNLCAFESSAPAKIRLAVQALNGATARDVTFPFALG